MLVGCKSNQTDSNKNNISAADKNICEIEKMNVDIVSHQMDFNSLSYDKKIFDDTILFSDESIVFYYTTEITRDEKEITKFYLVNRKTQKKSMCFSIDDFDILWGSPCITTDYIWVALGTVSQEKEASYIYKVNKHNCKAEDILIQDCNTKFCSVTNVGDAVYVWYMNEDNEENSKTDYLAIIEENKIHTLDSWKLFKDSYTGKMFSTMGGSSDKLYCYIESGDKKGEIQIYDDTGTRISDIKVPFGEFLAEKGDKTDYFLRLYVFEHNNSEDDVVLESFNHRCLAVKFVNDNYIPYQGEFLEMLKNPGTDEEFLQQNGNYIIAKRIDDLLFLTNPVADYKQLLIWDVKNRKVDEYNYKLGNMKGTNIGICGIVIVSKDEIYAKGIDDNGEYSLYNCPVE